MTRLIERPRKQKISADIRLKNNRLGMKLFQASWMMVFVALVVVNWQLRYSYAQWPPAGVQPLNPTLPGLATLTLIFSAWRVHRSLKTLRGGHLAAFLAGWRLAIGCGLVFMALIGYEFVSAAETALATQYGATFRLMTGFHLVHALAILALMIKVCRDGGRGLYSGAEHDSWAVEGAAQLWYFVTAAWMLFYVVLYWLG